MGIEDKTIKDEITFRGSGVKREPTPPPTARGRVGLQAALVPRAIGDGEKAEVTQPLDVSAIFRNFPIQFRIGTSWWERFGAQFRTRAQEF